MGTVSDKDQSALVDPDRVKLTQVELLARSDMLRELFVWNDTNTQTRPFSFEIYNFWHSERVPKELKAIKRILFDDLSGHDEKQIGKIRFNEFTVNEPNYNSSYKNTVDILIDCIEKFEAAVVADGVLDMICDEKDSNDTKEKNNNEEEKQDSQGSNLSDTHILRISFACIYYCRAYIVERRNCENDSPYDSQRWYPLIFADLLKSLKYYDLAKTRIKLCRGFMRSYTAKTEAHLQQTIGLLLNGIKRNKLL